MHKVFTFGLFLMSSLLIVSTAIFPSINTNSFPNANAIELDQYVDDNTSQMYSNNNDIYRDNNNKNNYYLQRLQSQQQHYYDYDYNSYIYKTSNSYSYNDNYADDGYNAYSDKVNNKYECQEGPFEGFFVSSPEFCFREKISSSVKISPPVQKETLTIVKNTDCQADQEICEQNPIQPSNFTIIIEEGNNPSQTTFPGSSTPGTNIQLKPGTYSVSEEGLDPVTPEICNTMGFDAGRNASDFGQNLFICTNFSDECEGDITIGNPRICTIDNVLVQQNVVDNNVYVVWSESIPGNSDIFFARSADNGQTFNSPQNISQNTGNSNLPQISYQGNNVYVTWSDHTLGSVNVFFAFSTDNGQTFSSPQNISQNTGDSGLSQISSQGNNVYVVWQNLDNGDVFFAFSTDNGQTFSSPANISNNTGESRNPQISSQGNNVYVVWEDFTPGISDIFFAFSTDNGQTFSSPQNISENDGESFFPRISSQENNVYVTWADESFRSTPGNSDIFFVRSADNGQTFSSPQNISENDGISTDPQISSQGNNVYVVWEDNAFPLRPDIFFAFSTDNGQTFSSPENVSQNPRSSFNPQISSQGNNVYVVWGDDSPIPNPDIFFAFSTDNGQTFSSPANISKNTSDSFDPRISSQGNNVYVVWIDNKDTPNSNFDTFFVRSADNGQTFSNPENISQNIADTSDLQIAKE